MNSIYQLTQDLNSHYGIALNRHCETFKNEEMYSSKYVAVMEAGHTIGRFEKIDERLFKYQEHLKSVLIYLNRLIQLDLRKVAKTEEIYPDGATNQAEIILGTITRNFFEARKYLAKLETTKNSLDGYDQRLLEKLEPIFEFCSDVIIKIEPALNEGQKIFYEKYPYNELISRVTGTQSQIQCLDGKSRILRTYSLPGRHTQLNSDFIYIPNLAIKQNDKPKARIAVMLLDGVTGSIGDQNEHTGRLIARELPKLIDKHFQNLLHDTDNIQDAFKQAVDNAAQEFKKIFGDKIKLDDYASLELFLSASTNFSALIETQDEFIMAHLGDSVSIMQSNGYSKTISHSQEPMPIVGVGLKPSALRPEIYYKQQGDIEFHSVPKFHIAPGSSYFTACTDGLFSKRVGSDFWQGNLTAMAGTQQKAVDFHNAAIDFGHRLRKKFDPTCHSCSPDDQTIVTLEL